MAWFRINETEYLCHCIAEEAGIRSPTREKCADYSTPLLLEIFPGARGERDLAISLGIPGSEQSSWSSPEQQAPFSLEVWTNGHCVWDRLEQQGASLLQRLASQGTQDVV